MHQTAPPRRAARTRHRGSGRVIRERLREIGGGLPRPFWVLFAGLFVNRIGTFAVPFMAIYLTQAHHFSLATAGAVASLWGAGAMIASPVGGYLADHVGRRRTMVGALALGGCGMIALGFAHGLAQIAPAVFLVALVGESYRPAMQAAVADIVPAADRIRAYGLVYWVINLGVAIGLTLGGALAARSFLLLFAGDGLTSLAFALIVWRALPETRPAPGTHGSALRPHGLVRGFLAPYRDRPFLVFIGLSALVLLVFMQHATALPRASWRRGCCLAFLAFAARVLLAFTAAACRACFTFWETCAGAFFAWAALPRPGCVAFGFAGAAFAAAGFFTTAPPRPGSRL